MGNESDEENIDEMANLLESELLRSSPIRQSIKSQSLLRKVQTRMYIIFTKLLSHTSRKHCHNFLYLSQDKRQNDLYGGL
jgi:hypothetical protein